MDRSRRPLAFIARCIIAAHLNKTIVNKLKIVNFAYAYCQPNNVGNLTPHLPNSLYMTI